MNKPRILAFAGSTRKESFNRRLLRLAVQAVNTQDVTLTHVELADFVMPLFNQDLEDKEGVPESARRFKELMKSHDGFLICAPEYNSSITPLLKNTLDWASRQEKGETPLVCFKGKVVGLLSASPSVLGGLRGLVHLRSMLGNIGCLVVPTQFALVKAHEAFNADGTLKDEKQLKLVNAVVDELITVTSKLKKI